jgi:hypothetical protein
VYGPDLHGTSEWSQWFGKHICPFDKEWSWYVTVSIDQLLFLGLALPYVKQPASDPVFETFFTKHWVDNYTTSLHNFLATIFHNMRKSH